MLVEPVGTWITYMIHQVVQQSTVRGEITREPMMMGKSAYSRMLRDVRRRVEGDR